MSLERMRQTLLALCYGIAGLKPSPRRRSLRAEDGPERGDVPGWVMITLVTGA
jgi:hypothetical protein